jgi:biopolymer transport protein ExbB
MKHCPDRAVRAVLDYVSRLACPALLLLPLVATVVCHAPQTAVAQEARRADTGPQPAGAPNNGALKSDALKDAERKAEAALAAPTAGLEPLPSQSEMPRVNLLELWVQGGVLMIPITFMSVVVVIFACERFLALRRRKVIPPKLVKGLGQLATRPGGLDPRQAYRLCQEYPSAAANVFRAVLLKVGRPHAEVERAETDSSEHEAAKLYKNVRPLNLATTVTPLLGLLGTVQGMIMCFFQTANLPAHANKTQTLANGIYIALVTTFGGLVVAIPSALLAHYFEGRIQTLFREIHELLSGLMPQLERYEGKLRVSGKELAAADDESTAPRPPERAPAAAARK